MACKKVQMSTSASVYVSQFSLPANAGDRESDKEFAEAPAGKLEQSSRHENSLLHHLFVPDKSACGARSALQSTYTKQTHSPFRIQPA